VGEKMFPKTITLNGLVTSFEMVKRWKEIKQLILGNRQGYIMNIKH